jgi:hypothetical protein
MNGWEKHSLDHSSASAINMWCGAPDAWVAKYLLKKQFSFSLAARAGTIVEEAVVNVLARGWTLDAAIAEAQAQFNKASAFGASDADRKRGEAVPGMITLLVEELKQYGEPTFDADLFKEHKQKKIELMCRGDGWDMPIHGYLDLFYPQHGLVIDIKSTMRLPSEMSDEHLRQGAIYRAAMGNCGMKFIYASGKNIKVYEVTDHIPILAEIKTILSRQERFLRLGDAALLQSIVPLNCNSYYWSEDADTRKEIYGI